MSYPPKYDEGIKYPVKKPVAGKCGTHKNVVAEKADIAIIFLKYYCPKYSILNT